VLVPVQLPGALLRLFSHSLVGLAIYGLASPAPHAPALPLRARALLLQGAPRACWSGRCRRRREHEDYANSVIHACTNWLDICYILVLTRVMAVFGVSNRPASCLYLCALTRVMMRASCPWDLHCSSSLSPWLWGFFLLLRIRGSQLYHCTVLRCFCDPQPQTIGTPPSWPWPPRSSGCPRSTSA